MSLNPEDIRHARPIDLERITGINASSFVSWSMGRGISEKNLTVLSEALGMSKAEVLAGLELRREDAAIARQVAEKIDRLMSAA